jgi:hypothetical protein
VRTPGQASNQQLYVLRRAWDLLTEKLPPENRSENYLAGVIAQATGASVADLLDNGALRWDALTAVSVVVATEAVKSKLRRLTV